NGTADTAAYSAGLYSTTIDFRIGARTLTTPTEPWDGLIGGVGVVNKVTSDDEDTFLWNNGVKLTYAELGAPDEIAPKLERIRVDATGDKTHFMHSEPFEDTN